MGSSFRLVVVALVVCTVVVACSTEKPIETVKPKKEPPRLNVITLKISPADAVVRVDGKVSSKRKLQLVPSQKGYLIQVTAKYCKPYETRVSAQSNMSLKVDLEDDPMAARAGAKDDPKTLTPLAQKRRDKYVTRIASIFGRDSALGTDAADALGGLIGNQIGEAYGVGGLGLRGSGDGGNGFRVNSGTPTVKGPLTSVLVSTQLNKQLKAVRACFSPALKGKPKLEGKVLLQLIIDGQGKVRMPKVTQNTLKKVKVGKCLAAALMKCSFPAPRNRKKVRVTWPLKVSVARASGGGGGGIGIGTIGTIGRRGGSHGTRPRVILGRPAVRGSLNGKVIQRIVSRHINELRYCYQKELQRTPALMGRMVFQFTISGTGHVVMAVIQSSTMKNKRIEVCTAKAVRRWRFPKPKGGGIVIVSHPVVFRTVKSTATRARFDP